MVKRRRYRRKLFKLKLKKDTIYTLSSLILIFGGIFFLFSYSKSGVLPIRISEYLDYYFGFLSFLMPINLILLGLLLSRMRSKITKPNVSLGFLLFSFSLISLFKSGQTGEQIFSYLYYVVSLPLTYAILVFGSLIGFVLFSNISLSEIVKGVIALFKSIYVFFTKKFLPLFKTKREIFVKDVKPITIKGLKPQSQKEVKEEAAIKVRDGGAVAEKSGNLPQDIVLNKPLEQGAWEYPPLSLLSDTVDKKAERGDIKKTASTIEKTLYSFGVRAKVVEINLGPSVTQYALEIVLGTKLSKITGLSNDLALATEAPGGQIRIEAPIPGRSLVGIEIPNKSLELVSLKTMLVSSVMQKAKSKLIVPLGLDVSGNPVISDITKMPHVLIAGTTGSGKSVMMNSFISSLLFRASPSEVRMILIDPKRVELTAYSNIPHLLSPIVVEPLEAVSALKWALKQMDDRYKSFAASGVRNIDSYNELAGFQALPYMVIMIDELADLMALAPVEVEDSIARLAQMARATGIHLVVSTQRPSVDVITGLIKANIPCRIAFNVSSMVDSKVIIDMPGAEKLLGRGDMLYVPPDQAKPTRVQGSFISEQDVKRLTTFLRSKKIAVEYTHEILEQTVNVKKGLIGHGNQKDKDEFFKEAIRVVCQYDRASSSLLQRRLSVGFARAARIIDQLEEAGVVGHGEGSKPRDVLIKDPEEFIRNIGGEA